jgi:hypothetical protein
LGLNKPFIKVAYFENTMTNDPEILPGSKEIFWKNLDFLSIFGQNTVTTHLKYHGTLAGFPDNLI